MKKQCLLGVLAAISLTISSAIAQANPEQQTKPADKKVDARLTKTISYKADKLFLYKVCEELKKSHEIPLFAGISERDWKSRERVVYVRINELELGAVMNALAKALHFYCGKFGDEPNLEYRIWADLKSRKFEEAMVISQKEAADKEVKELRNKVMEEAKKALSMTQEEAEAMKDKDPWLAYLGGTEEGRAFSNLMQNLTPMQQELMLRGKKITINFSEMQPDQLSSANKMVENSFFKNIPMFGDQMDKFEADKIVLMPMDEISGGMASAMGFAGMAMIMGKPKDGSSADQMSPFGGGVPLAMMPLAGADSPMANMFARFAWELKKGRNFMEVAGEMQSEFQSAFTESNKAKITPSPVPTDERLLQLVKPIPSKISGDQLKRILDHWSKQTKLSYIVDYYPGNYDIITAALPTDKQPLWKLLDTLQIINMEWEFSNGVVYIRPKDWAVQRTYDIPESFMEKYRGILKDRGWFDLTTMSVLASSLTTGQIMYRLSQDEIIQPAVTNLVSGRMFDSSVNLLKLYGTLTVDQKNRIASTNGLGFDMLSASQWQIISDLIEEESTDADISAGRILLTQNEERSEVEDKPAADKKATTKPGVKAAPPKSNDNLMFVSVKFTIEYYSRHSEKPREITKSMMLMGPSQIKSIAKMREDMKKRIEEQEKVKEKEQEKEDAVEEEPNKDEESTEMTAEANPPATDDKADE